MSLRITRLLPRLLAVALLATSSACVYKVDVQQGNLLKDRDIDAVQIGMTRSQVRFLLGTPVVDDPFHGDRWNYVYYYRPGSSSRSEKRWVMVLFTDDKVAELRRDVPFDKQR